MSGTLPHPYMFWLLLALCLGGFAVLYASVRDAGRGARRRAVQRRLDTLAAPRAEADDAAIEALREAMAQATRTMRQAAPKCRVTTRSPAPVPWFLFLGDAVANVPGLLAAARAEPVAAPASEPFGGDYWRWWLNGAMTAIAVHPSTAAEPEAAPHTRTLWLQSLMALAERRDRLPLNGLVVCVDAGTLLHGEPDDVRRLGTRLRRLADEAADALRLQMPFYLAVTGLERLTGYATLRGALPPEVMAQALGHRFASPFAAAGLSGAERMDAAFAPVARQLHALRMALLREETSASSRLAVHEFVEAVRALQPGLRELADVLFDPQGKGARGPRWRGLYLTAAMSGANGGAFVGDLFTRFLPSDQPLVRPGRAAAAA